MKADNNMPLITYITVVYNRENTIEKCINSVLNQDYPNIEYIIVDGASTDGTMDIVSRYKDRIDKVVSEKDSGIYNAMNKGVKLATGDLICFMNSDDECMPGAARTVAETYMKTGADIICGTRILLQEGAEVPEQTFTRYPIRHDCFRYIQMYHQSTYASRKLFDRIGGFDERYSLLADWIWESKAIDNDAKVEFIDDKLSIFNYDGASFKGIKKRDAEWIEWARETFSVLSSEDAELFINCLDRGRTPMFNAKVLTDVACKYDKDLKFIKTYYETMILVCMEGLEEFKRLDTERKMPKSSRKILGKDAGYDTLINDMKELLEISISSDTGKSLYLFKNNIEKIINLHDAVLYALTIARNKQIHKEFIGKSMIGMKENLKNIWKHGVRLVACDMRLKAKKKNTNDIEYMRKYYFNVRKYYT